jgi:hypothetical protein
MWMRVCGLDAMMLQGIPDRLLASDGGDDPHARVEMVQ